MVNNAIPGGERVGLHRICAVLQRSDPAASHARKEIVKKRLVRRRVYVADYMSHDKPPGHEKRTAHGCGRLCVFIVVG